MEIYQNQLDSSFSHACQPGRLLKNTQTELNVIKMPVRRPENQLHEPQVDKYKKQSNKKLFSFFAALEIYTPLVYTLKLEYTTTLFSSRYRFTALKFESL